MKALILGVAIGSLILFGATQAQAQQYGGHSHVQPRPIYSGGGYYSGGSSLYSGSYYGGGSNLYGGSSYGGYPRPAHYDFVPSHYDHGRGYVPSHVDVHIGGRRYEVLPGGYVSPYPHRRD